MLKFEKIRPYHDGEVNAAICSVINHPMLKAMMDFALPGVPQELWKNELTKINSIHEFQTKFIYKAVSVVLSKSSDGLTATGFDKLDKNTPYLYISNHRDIILDTSLINVSLFDNDLIMTASAIGDNLVKNPFLYELSKLNRNFLVLRGLPPRELLQSSKTMSEYVQYLITNENRSVWIAQREGRTKDGNDATHQGVLKMLTLADENQDIVSYFKKIKIVPVSISYEYDPTDTLKIPELIANANNQSYVKSDNEDFNTLLNGIIGQKKRIHIHAGKVIGVELDSIVAKLDNQNKQIQALAQIIDDAVISNFKLWPTNYVAYDLLHNTGEYTTKYTEQEKQDFVSRMNQRIDKNDIDEVRLFLGMYANPVANQAKYIHKKIT
jgi:1-acyl-sn-glycerol-3-phosphate acyltransferase